MSRPEVLFPLFADLTALDGVGPKTREALRPPGDRPARSTSILTLPTGGVDRRLRASVRDASLPEVVTVEVEVGLHQPAGRPRPPLPRPRPRRPHRVPARLLPRPRGLAAPRAPRRPAPHRLRPGRALRRPRPDGPPRPHPAPRRGRGAARLRAGLSADRGPDAARHDPRRRTRRSPAPPDLPEWIEPSLKRRRGWPDWRAALAAAHAPAGPADLAPAAPARERLAYDELLAHQLTLALARARMKRAKGFATRGDGRLRARVLAALPYAPDRRPGPRRGRDRRRHGLGRCG